MDIDSYYCQVVALRWQLNNASPIVVQQHHAIIAVNNAARDAGVVKEFQDMQGVLAAKIPHLVVKHIEVNEQ